MKKKNIFKIVIFIIVLLIFILLNYFGFMKKNKKEDTNNIDTEVQEDYMDMKNNSIMYNDDASLENLKTEYNIIGENDLYEVNTESDGRKVINVKASINYKVAFAGIIKGAKPTFEDVNSLFEKNAPNKNGIWITLADRDKILNYFNNNEYLKYKYKIDDEGYLQIDDNKNPTDMDKKIEKIINGKNQYILDISSMYYMVDTVTGQIVDNPYNELSRYQPYEYVKDEGKMIIFISENKDNYMTENDIFSSLMNLINSIE